ncbi:MAG: hypothetical protein EHM60_08755 [Lysobacterales bacterium]|jgi:hypothetical protein|nr:MAG: hypothetical protein EHM60_08755 [Xanthomonadales bacterium]
MNRHPALRICIPLACSMIAPAVVAQQAPASRPADKPPIAQGWIDIATFSSPGMPSGMAGMMMGGGAGNPLSALMGGKPQGNQFGMTQTGGAGSFVDVTVRTSRNPSLAEATQAVPAGTQLAPSLALKVLPQAKPVPERPDDTIEEPAEPPKGRIKLYWGCGTAVRDGQPKVLDFSTATTQQLGEIFRGRRATQRGAHAAPGRPVWPNPQDARLVPAGASFAGPHSFAGDGVPESFKFTIPPAQDLMPPIALQQAQVDGVTQLSWQPVPHARAYFIAAMGGRGDESGTAEMTLWTSSELPDSGFGLVDYQTNKSVDQWLKDKVLLAPATTRCDVPKGIFGEGEASGAMLRMIAYGSELNLAHPARPADPKVAWEPEWALKVRVKSVAMTMLGMPAMDGMDMGDAATTPPGEQPAAPAEGEKPKKKKFGLKDALDAVKDNVPLPN